MIESIKEKIEQFKCEVGVAKSSPSFLPPFGFTYGLPNKSEKYGAGDGI